MYRPSEGIEHQQMEGGVQWLGLWWDQIDSLDPSRTGRQDAELLPVRIALWEFFSVNVTDVISFSSNPSRDVRRCRPYCYQRFNYLSWSMCGCLSVVDTVPSAWRSLDTHSFLFRSECDCIKWLSDHVPLKSSVWSEEEGRFSAMALIPK